VADDRLIQELRDAIDAVAAQRAPGLVNEARSEAEVRVRARLAAAFEAALLDQAGRGLHSDTPEQPEHRPTDDFVPTEKLVRRQGVKPIASVDELAQPDPWQSDEEYEAFHADLYASRSAGLA